LQVVHVKRTNARPAPGVFTYDELLEKSPQTSIFAHKWWLEAVAPSAYEILEVVKGGRIKAAWPILRSIERARQRVYMPPLTQKLGILFAPSDANPAELQSANQSFTNELLDRLGDVNEFIQTFHENFTDWLPFFWRGYSQSTRYTYVLEDISDPKRLWIEMRPHHRRYIRRAERLGIEIRDDLQLDQFVELNRKTFERQGLRPPASDDIIFRVDEACRVHAGRKIFAGVDALGRVHAAVYVAWAANTGYYLMGGSEPELRASGAQFLALWESIKFASTVVTRFDFEGSMLPKVEPVFRGFGAIQRPYFVISKIPPPSLVRSLVKASRNRAAALIRSPHSWRRSWFQNGKEKFCAAFPMP